MGCRRLIVFDHDKVEAKNVPSQFYKASQVGQLKVDALTENVLEFTDVRIHTVPAKYQDFAKKEQIPTEVLICAVDSMDERNDIWQLVKRNWTTATYKMVCYIDARMGGELLRILTVNMFDSISIEKYEKRLFPSSKAAKEVCTAKSIMYNTFFCGGAIASTVKKYAKKEDTKYDFYFDIKSLMTN
jgi:hypothetical protein